MPTANQTRHNFTNGSIAACRDDPVEVSSPSLHQIDRGTATCGDLYRDLMSQLC